MYFRSVFVVIFDDSGAFGGLERGEKRLWGPGKSELSVKKFACGAFQSSVLQLMNSTRPETSPKRFPNSIARLYQWGFHQIRAVSRCPELLQ